MATKNPVQITAEPGGKEIVVTHVIDAPRELVFKAFTDPKLLPQWWGPARYTTTIDKLEVRPGGAWRFVHRDAEGNKYAFHGEFREISPPQRLAQTFEYEGMPGHVSLETMTLEEEDGKTKLKAVASFQSVEDRDGMFQGEEGMIESYERLDALLQREAERTT